ncbi:hypothetical protein KOW79_008723 [Hemibagrus wyckioides]|uniref:Uncharacterized protein n=1 Tax=Hemibagrus wyckioides TaxID=337641 RepID=A0A9D3NRS3_9TELE|nr:hypothetical protein KOW79_008723 [Hemibagrus wyckioides]
MESVADLPLRPLLLAAGAAATAASISYLVKRDDGETADPEDTEYQATIISPAWCPVCEQATEPALVQSTKVHQDQMMEWEEEQETHRLLKSQYQERMENLTNNEKLLNVNDLLMKLRLLNCELFRVVNCMFSWCEIVPPLYQGMLSGDL